jgi:chemotaxis protein MotA
MAESSPEKKSSTEEKKAPKKTSAGPDFATIGGFILAIGAIAGGLLMEGGKIADVAQVTSALIVLGGTIGAVMITTPLTVLIRAAKQLPSVFFPSVAATDTVIEEIIEYATAARKNGIVSLEQQAAAIQDPFLRKALGLAVDGIETGNIREIMELEISLSEHHSDAEAKVFEAAGGYAPTIGIIGAVLGLIQVMKNLANIEEVGRGIAVAFVATIYGVAVANIVFLPAANKLKARAQEKTQIRELMLEGVLSIAEGLNQKLIRMKLEAYSEKHGKEEKAKKKQPAGAKNASEAPPNAAPAEG